MTKRILRIIVITFVSLPLMAQERDDLGRMQTLIERMAYQEALDWADSCRLLGEEALCLKAKAQSELGRLSEAIATYRTIINVAPLNPTVYRLEAELHISMQDYKAATETLRSGYERTSDISTGYSLAKLLVHLGQDSAAMAVTDQILRQDSVAPVIRLRAKSLKTLHRPQKAIELLENQLRRDSTDFLSLIDLASLYAQLGEIRLMEKATARYLKIDSLNTSLLLLHAEAMMLLQEADSALQDYECVIRQGNMPTAFKDLFYCGLAFYKAERWGQAEAFFSRADAAAYEQNYMAKYYYAMCAFRQEQWAEAEKRMANALELIQPKADRLTEVHTILGRCIAEQGRTENAISHLRYAVEYDRGNSEACLLLGQCFERMGNRSGAIHMYRLVVDKERYSSAQTDAEAFRRLAEARTRLSLIGPEEEEEDNL